MTAVVGIDLSSKATDLVKLDETTNAAEWTRVELTGKTAWDRTLTLPALMPTASWWDDVYLVAIEAPYGSNQGGTQAILNRVVGAIVASVPEPLRRPERCWIVRPDEWKTGLGLKGKPTDGDLSRVAPGWNLNYGWICHPDRWDEIRQNAHDAYCLALFARTENARGISA